MNYKSEITSLKGVGDKTAKLFEKLNIFTIEDLIRHFPKDYSCFDKCKNIIDIVKEKPCVGAFVGTVTASAAVRYVKKLSIISVIVRDREDTTVKLTFFNMPYLKNTLKPGAKYVFYGSIYERGSMYCMDHPKLYQVEEYEKLVGALQPVYSLTKGISNDTLKKYIKQAIKQLDEIPEFIPKQILEKNHFMSYGETFRHIHFPDSREDMIRARKRLSYEEFFFFVLSMKYRNQLEDLEEQGVSMIEVSDTKRLIEALPYRLTKSQLTAWKEIENDLIMNRPANRLIQGDVGSGKTIIAILALLNCAANHHQGALMAPTEVLALQHFETLTEMTKKYNLVFQPVLLVGSMTAKQKREVYEKIENGECNVIIGTHALIQEKLMFHDLALVVTDEQHRFGVKQRDLLSSKGNGFRPHTLVMSATPIPRSLAIILYGDLSVSTIPELPANRLPIKNCVVGINSRDTSYHFIEGEVLKGHQAYVICPMIESGVMDELENVIDYTKKLEEKLNKTVRVAYLHGKMKPALKNQIMLDFAEHKIDVLVSTTVIEVGINVPNATVMMVENAERFGLATLHQIRGRVGRGAAQSYCIFIDSKESKTSKERLEILNKSNDGFFIANEDLRLRGPGDLTGTLQSGDFCFRYADIYADSDMLMQASKDVEILMKEDPLLEQEKHKLCSIRCKKYFEDEYINVI